MFKKKTTFISAIIFGAFLAIGFSTNYIKAISFNDIKSGYLKLKRAITGKTIITANNETLEAANAILTIKTQKTNENEEKIVLEIPIKKASLGSFWVPSSTKTIDLPTGEYNVYLNTKPCNVVSTLTYNVIVYRQTKKAKVMSYLGGDPLYYMGDTLNAGKLGDEIFLETIKIPSRGISRTYTIFTPSQELGPTTLRNLDLTKRTIAIKCGAANSLY